MAYIDIAEVRKWSRAAGKIARHYFHSAHERQRKADNSYVTRADLEIEQLLRERIRQYYPDHGIVGEEQGIGDIEREYVWALDPLDGTDAFVSGLPVWGVSVGLLRHGEPYLGVVYLPLIDECYWNDGQGHAYCNNDPIAVYPYDTFDTQDGLLVPSRMHTEYESTFPGKVRSLGSFAAHCCYVARGSALGALLGYAQLWDVAAGLAILHDAGGAASMLDGQPLRTHTMLDGSKPTQPLFISTPGLIEHLLPYVEFRGRV